MTQLICDKCGRYIGPATRSTICFDRHYNVKLCSRIFNWPNFETRGYDLCEDCAKEIIDLIKDTGRD